MKNALNSTFFNQDLRRFGVNPIIATPNWRFGTRLSVKRFGMEVKMKFKKLTAADAEWNALADYAENCSWGAGRTLAEKMRQNQFTGWERVILAEDHGHIAGYCTVSGTDCIPDVPYMPYIGMLFIGEEYRGKRLSRRMIDYASDYLKEIGFAEVYLVSDHENLYEKYGFQVIDEKMAPWGRMQKIYRRTCE